MEILDGNSKKRKTSKLIAILKKKKKPLRNDKTSNNIHIKVVLVKYRYVYDKN